MTDITSRDTLGQAVLEWLGRDDDPNDDVKRNITTMIQLAQIKLETRLKGVRCLNVRAVALLNEEWEWAPSDLAYISSVSLLPGGVEAQEYSLKYKTEEQFVVERLRLIGGPISIYTTVGKQLRFGPWGGAQSAGTQFRLIYWAKPVRLSDTVPTNDLLDAHPEIYFYATLVESAPYIGDDARVQLWRAALDDALAQAGAEADAWRGTMTGSHGGWRP